MLYNKIPTEKQYCTHTHPIPSPPPHPTPNVFVKIVFLQPISEKLLESPYTFFVILFLNTIYAVNSSPNNVTHLLALTRCNNE